MSFKIAAAILWAMAAGAQPAQQPFQARAASTVTLTKVGDTEELDITNVTYEVTPTYVPGRPGAERLLLRQTCTSQAILEEPEWGATTVLEAWPLGASLSQKPIYTIKATGTGGRTVDGSLFVIERGTGELEWRSVYQLGTGQHLFDTYVPLVGFSISREALEMRYIGFEVPPDDVADARLKQPNVVGVITYASAEGKKHEALLTAATPKTAAELRSYSDATRTVSVVEGATPKGIRIFISHNAPSPANPISLTIPVAADDIDVEHAQLPAGFRLSRWKR
ncbi:MAG: hypothetical protein ABSE35_03080 [Bryobacteraceae bacterium]